MSKKKVCYTCENKAIKVCSCRTKVDTSKMGSSDLEKLNSWVMGHIHNQIRYHENELNTLLDFKDSIDDLFKKCSKKTKRG